MKNLFFNIRNRFKSRKQTPVTTSFEKVESIGILVNNPDFSVNDVLNRFVSSLIDKGKEVKVICYIDKGANRLYEFKYEALRNGDITWSGQFKSSVVNNFVKTEFDYLYSINISPFLPFENILLTSRAKFRIGMYMPGKEKYLDLMFQMGEKPSLPALIDQMCTFTKKIVSNE